MTTLNVPPASGITGGPMRSAEARSSVHTEEALAGAPSVAALGFEALLDIARLPIDSRRNGANGKASPTQMFDRLIPDAHERRRSTLQQRYRAELTTQSQRDLDARTGIDARSHETSGASRGESRGLSLHGNREPSGGGNDAFLKSALASPDAAEGFRGRSSGAGSALEAPGNSAHSSGLSTPMLGVSGGPHATPGSRKAVGEASAKVLPADSTRPSDGARRVGPEGPAGNLARLLASGRRGGMDVTRATQPSPTASEGEAPSRRAESRSPARPQTAETTSGSERSDKARSTGTDGADRSMFDRLVRSIRLSAGTRRSSATLQLHPPELGRLHVGIRMEDGRVRIEVRTETKAARDLVQQRAVLLTAALERQGLHVEHFDVSADLADGGSTESSDGGGPEVPARNGHRAMHDGLPTPLVAPGPDDADRILDPGKLMDVVAAAETRLDIRI